MRFLVFVTVWSICQTALSQGFDPAIKVNQVGYYPHSVKVAIVPECSSKMFYVKEKGTDQIAYEGVLGKAECWEFSGERVHVAEFSELSEAGRYYISCDDPDVQDSYPFQIKQNVYNELAKASLMGFYLARASTDLEEAYVGKFHRPGGHPDERVIVHRSAASAERPEGSIISSPGGWYDAGDYNKYITNSGITTFTLLHLFELSAGFSEDIVLDIPENQNKLPDLLDEILWNLRWMMSMQDPNDGGVYHKLTHKRFMEVQMPHEVSSPRYVVMKTTAAALDLAAVCAKAARLTEALDDHLPGFADSCLLTAKKAWDWAVQNPKVYYEQPQDIKTGAYGGTKLKDEWAWASIELFLTTGKRSYLPPHLENALKYDAPEWGRVGSLGIYSLILDNTYSLGSYKKIEKRFLKSADKMHQRYRQSAYQVSIDSFPWGSNSHALNEGIFLHMAYLHTSEKKYLDAAEATLHYVLGRNALGVCFVTGEGSRSPMHIHDRRSRADGIDEPIPGLLVGGPSKQALQDCGEEAYPSPFPALSWIDDVCSYSTNEVAINWNAALSFLVNALEYGKP